MQISPAQCRAARGLLDWTQQQLADAAKVGNATIRNFEAGKSTPQNATLDVLQRALEAAGVEFTNGGQPGVKMKADRTYGFVYDDQRIIGRVEDGEFRAESGGRELIAVVKDGNLHDPKTGERICSLTELGSQGSPLPASLKAKMPPA